MKSIDPYEELALTTEWINWIGRMYEEQIATRTPYVFIIKSVLPIFKTLSFDSAISELVYKKKIERKAIRNRLTPLRFQADSNIKMWKSTLQEIDPIRKLPPQITEVEQAAYGSIVKERRIEIFERINERFRVRPDNNIAIEESTLYPNYNFARLSSHILKSIEDLETDYGFKLTTPGYKTKLPTLRKALINMRCIAKDVTQLRFNSIFTEIGTQYKIQWMGSAWLLNRLIHFLHKRTGSNGNTIIQKDKHIWSTTLRCFEGLTKDGDPYTEESLQFAKSGKKNLLEKNNIIRLEKVMLNFWESN